VNYFEALLLGHLVGDFVLQTGWMAREKVRNAAALLSHAAVYTAAVGVAGRLAGGISLVAVALVFVSHAVLDRRTLVHWWGRHVQEIRREADAWLYIVTDQVAHLLILAAVTALR
jgi:hypothetical protein